MGSPMNRYFTLYAFFTLACAVRTRLRETKSEGKCSKIMARYLCRSDQVKPLESNQKCINKLCTEFSLEECCDVAKSFPAGNGIEALAKPSATEAPIEPPTTETREEPADDSNNDQDDEPADDSVDASDDKPADDSDHDNDASAFAKMQEEQWVEPCSNHPDLDEWKPATNDMCYLRMYRCDDDTKVNLSNKNAGDAEWGMTGLMDNACGFYGSWLKVWRVQVNRSALVDEVKNSFSRCNDNKCESKHFGFQNDEHFVGAKWFSFPEEARGSEYEILCLERTISLESCKLHTDRAENVRSAESMDELKKSRQGRSC